MPELVFSEEYHGGMDPQLFQKWDGKKWTTISGWIQPYEDIVKEEIKKSAAAYREEIKKKN
jgi:branched-chain amino acid transport system substrate-binding protein